MQTFGEMRRITMRSLRKFKEIWNFGKHLIISLNQKIVLKQIKFLILV